MAILERFKQIMNRTMDIQDIKTVDEVDGFLITLYAELKDVRAATSVVIADEKLALQKFTDCEKQIEVYCNAIDVAVSKEQNDDARKMIAKKQQFEAQLSILKDNHLVALSDVSNIKKLHDKIQMDIEQLESRRAVLRKTSSDIIIPSAPRPIAPVIPSLQKDDAVEKELEEVRNRLKTKQ